MQGKRVGVKETNPYFEDYSGAHETLNSMWQVLHATQGSLTLQELSESLPLQGSCTATIKTKAKRNTTDSG